MSLEDRDKRLREKREEKYRQHQARAGGLKSGDLEAGEEQARQATNGKQQSFIKQFDGSLVAMTLTTGEVLTGKLHTDFYNKYEYLLEEDSGLTVIRKDAVAYIKLKAGK